jgi:hypothetical protein
MTREEWTLVALAFADASQRTARARRLRAHEHSP